MPTTTLVNTTLAANTLGARTDSGGGAVADLTAEESRLANATVTPGYLKPTNAFIVRPQASPNMTVRVGSGNAKEDHYIVGGVSAGQGNYCLRLDVATQNITISAAEASQTRTDEIYLVVRDTAYDSSALVLPQLAYRKGDAGGAIPGPDATWKAWALLARVPVAAGATSISSVTDMRFTAGVPEGLLANLRTNFVPRPGTISTGDLLLGNGSTNSVDRLPRGSRSNVLRVNSDLSVGWSDLGVSTFRYMQANEGNNTTSFIDVGRDQGYDPGNDIQRAFVFNPVANSRYIVEVFLVVDMSNTGTNSRLKLVWGIGGTLDWMWSLIAPSYGSTANPTGDVDYRAFGTGAVGGNTQVTVGTGDSNTDGIRIQGQVINSGSGSGTLGLQYACETSGQTAYIQKNSYMRITRIA
ncbi:hypothetical protein WHI96_07885 [Pseudonocardia tropica]|uniref:Tail fiber protein n=1 Tax=Pseudonocardia tropica TaxID=681289 RepID=A0ABV1JS16_9PSEU